MKENMAFQIIYEGLTKKAMQCFETIRQLSSNKNYSTELILHYEDQAIAYLDSLMVVAYGFESDEQIALETYKECEYMALGDLYKKYETTNSYAATGTDGQ